MRGRIGLEDLKQAPGRDTVLRTQGIPKGYQVSERVEALVEQARELYEALARPVGIIADISLTEFLEVYEGDGRNADPSPFPALSRTPGVWRCSPRRSGSRLGGRLTNCSGATMRLWGACWTGSRPNERTGRPVSWARPSASLCLTTESWIPGPAFCRTVPATAGGMSPANGSCSPSSSREGSISSSTPAA